MAAHAYIAFPTYTCTKSILNPQDLIISEDFPPLYKATLHTGITPQGVKTIPSKQYILLFLQHTKLPHVRVSVQFWNVLAVSGWPILFLTSSFTLKVNMRTTLQTQTQQGNINIIISFASLKDLASIPEV